MSLVQALKNEAARLGFERVGVTSPDPPQHFSAYEKWLQAGQHGEMLYLASERARSRRANPSLILPECQSILVLAARYPIGTHHSEVNNQAIVNAEIMGSIAAYACGADYHDLFLPRLHAIITFLEAQVGHSIPNRYYTDTGPLLERDLAQRAGLGWIGKNTCLIAPGLGSYILLAEILLGMELEPDPPFLADRCGTCTRCIQACPTGCILPDRTLDAQRCISYLTIEYKGVIPPDQRSQMGNWIFGCDICQQVCPWNRSVYAQPEGCQVNLLSEISLSADAFQDLYRGRPLMRAKYNGYLRNVAVALGNSQEPSATPALSHCLQLDSAPLLRSHAAWALGRIGTSLARKVLSDSLQVETDPVVRHEIQSALEGCPLYH